MAELAPRRREATRLFVYGTLLRGEPHHSLIAEARFLGAARTAPAYSLVDCGPYPGLVAPGATSVQGELFAVDRPTLEILDAFEEHPELFFRCDIEIADSSRAQAYLLQASGAGRLPPIPNGDWRSYRGILPNG